jgi:cell division transport system permease protein
MAMITFKRVVRAGYTSFRRNAWLSLATIMITMLALFVIGNLVFLGAFATTVLAELESHIDVSIYFQPTASEQDIFSVKQDLEEHADVADVSYTSRDAALAAFRERNKDNKVITGALTELGENPLEASLNIKAKDSSRFASIAAFLDQKNYPVVDKVNFFENERVVERLGSILTAVRASGAVLALVLAVIAMLVAFNTFRLVIYTMREEIGIMRLVGGTSWFIRGPFLVAGALYGFFAALITTLIFFPITWYASPKLSFLVPEFSLFGYFTLHLVEFFLIMLTFGVGLGILSSFVAVRRYLHV